MSLDVYGLFQKYETKGIEDKKKHEVKMAKLEKQFEVKPQTQSLCPATTKGKSGYEAQVHIFAVCQNFLKKSKLENPFTAKKFKEDIHQKEKRQSIANHIIRIQWRSI